MMFKNQLFIIIMIIAPLFQMNAQEKQEDLLKYSMKTRWAGDVDPKNVWPEYPRPQMVRNEWVNLNGFWQYAIKGKMKSNLQHMVDKSWFRFQSNLD